MGCDIIGDKKISLRPVGKLRKQKTKIEMQNKNRKSIRLKEFDYSEPGDYFITICVDDRSCLFGEIVDSEMILNEAGKMISKWWLELKDKFSNVYLDEFIIMPNHIHGILTILCEEDNSSTVGEPLCGLPENGRPHRAAPTISDIIDWFKTMTTNQYIRNVKINGWKPFNKQIWQRSFHDHIIRNDYDLEEIRTYIISNPAIWDRDKNNPKNIS